MDSRSLCRTARARRLLTIRLPPFRPATRLHRRGALPGMGKCEYSPCLADVIRRDSRNEGEETMAQEAGIKLDITRRGFVGTTALAASGPMAGNGGGIPQAHAQAGGAAAPAQPKGPQYL